MIAFNYTGMLNAYNEWLKLKEKIYYMIILAFIHKKIM